MIFHFIFLCFACKADLVFAPILSSFSVINLPPTSRRRLFREANFNVGVKFPWLLKDRFMSYKLPGCYYDFLKLKGFGFNVFLFKKYFDPKNGRFTHPMKQIQSHIKLVGDFLARP